MRGVARRGAGPTTVVAARAGVGLVSREPWVVGVPAGVGVTRHVLECGLDGVTVEPCTELSWTVLPEGEGGLETLWDSTSVAVDLRFDDGTWLSQAAVVDQYGGGVGASAQGAAKRLWVDQWNLRRVDLTPVTGRRIEEVVATVAASSGRSVRVFLDDVRIRRAAAAPATGLDAVSTTRGSHSSDRFSRGNTAPLVGLPHGGVFGLPMTDASSGSWPYAYHAHVRDTDVRPAIEAFATSHLPSPWMGDRGVFQVMPSPSTEPDCSRTGRALGFDHEQEIDRPHLYRVELDGGVVAEMTAGAFALGLRFHLPEPQGSVVLDHLGSARDLAVRDDGGVTVVELVVDDRPGTPPHAIHLRVPGVAGVHLSESDGTVGGHLVVDSDDSGHVDVGIGISTVGVAQAARNLDDAGEFDTMLERAKAAWVERLATLVPSGATADQVVSLCSGLYRTFLYPSTYAEGARRAEPAFRSPYDPDVLGTGRLSTTHGFWDTYRTAWPLLALLTPAAAGELADGFVRHADLGGWTPRWSAPGAEDCMTGTTLDVVLADLAVRDVPGIDLRRAYDTALRNASAPADDPRVGRKGLRPGLFRGWISTDIPEGMSWTLDNAINDWGAAQLARLARPDAPPAGEPDDPAHDWGAEYEWLARRSLGYRNVFDRDRGFFIGRDADGAWREPFDPDVWGHDYTETNAWGTAFTAHHDGRGLVDLHGGEEALGTALDTFFARPETGAAALSGHYGFAIHEMTEARDVRMGMLGLSNQPAHHIPFMYMFAGRHDDAHRVVRECLDRLFVGSDLGQGYPGDEDNGEMSAWYVFASIGIYPLVPGSGTYVLVPPSLRRSEIRSLGGEPVTIEVVAGEPGADPYLRAVRVDGEDWHDISLPHSLLASGCHIEVELSPTPCGWGRDSRPVSASDVHGYADPPSDVLDRSGARGVEGADRLVDDLGENVIHLTAGDVVTLPFVEPTRLSLVTVTADEPGPRSWRLDLLDADGSVLASRIDAKREFRWAGQTRVFTAPAVIPAHGVPAALRLTALTAYDLRQVEAIAADHSSPEHTPAPDHENR